MTYLPIVFFFQAACFLALLVHAVMGVWRHRSPTAWRLMLTFGALALAVSIALAQSLDPPLFLHALVPLAHIEETLIAIYAGLFFLLVGDSMPQARALRVTTSALIAVGIVVIWVAPYRPENIIGEGTFELPIQVTLLAFFCAIQGYVAVRFAIRSLVVGGLAQLRMRLVASGVMLVIVATILDTASVTQGIASPAQVTARLLITAAVALYYLGFAAPHWLRRLQRRRHHAVADLFTRVLDCPDEQQALATVIEAAAYTVGGEHAAIYQRDRETGMLRPVASWGMPHEQSVSLQETVLGRSYRDGRAHYVQDLANEPGIGDELGSTPVTRSAFYVPLQIRQQTIGVLAVFAPFGPIFARDELITLTPYARAATLAIEHFRALRARLAAEQAQAQLQLQDEFLLLTAHELRTPITTVLATAQMLARRVSRGRPIDDPAPLELIERQGRRLAQLVNELLDYRRIADGQLEILPREGDLVPFVTQVVEAMGPEFPRATLSIDCALPELRVVLDPSYIEQVLHHLIENAAKYSAEDKAITVRLECVDDRARISIIDHGIGVPAHEREQVFEPYWRAANSPSIHFGGLGLGLTISRAIIERHQGQIWLEETPGGGTTAIFELPLPLASIPAHTAADEDGGDSDASSGPLL